MRFAQRLPSLDGLRGLAAVVVVIHHGLLTFPALSDAYFAQSERDQMSVWWLLAYTPLHVFWEGREAVFLFFVLSGVVLVLPVLRAGRRFSWIAYYPRRMVRLYLPLMAAVVLGAVIIALVPRVNDPALGQWVGGRIAGYTPGLFVRDLVVLFGPSFIISPLWSLQWEVAFSLLLPLFVLLVVLVPKVWWLKLALVLGAIGLGSALAIPALFFLPMFAVGALLIAEWDRIGRFGAWLDRRRGGWWALLAVAIALTTSTWWEFGLGAPASLVLREEVLPVIGVALLVVAAGFWHPFVRFLETPLLAWFGLISFSLYLVHEPIIVSARILTSALPPWVGLLISWPLAFGVAALFSRFIEQPSHRLSKRVGAAAAALVEWTRSRTGGGAKADAQERAGQRPIDSM